MAWVKIDDHFDEHPKMANIGLVGMGLWLAGLAYCNRNLTDGFIPWNVARRLGSLDVVEDNGNVWTLGRTSGMAGDDLTNDWIIGLLIDAGLWEEERTDAGRITGYRIHDFDDYQPSKEEVEREREHNAQRQKRFRDQRRERNAVTNSDRNGSVTPLVTDLSRERNDRPVPVPVPVVKDSLQEGGGRAPARKLTPREIATTTLREFGVSDKTVERTLAVFDDTDMPRMALTAAKFVSHWDGKRLKDHDRAWANWIKQEAKYQAEERANAPPERPLPDYARPFPVIRLNGGS